MSYNDKFLTLFSKDFDSIDNKCDYDDQNTFNGIVLLYTIFQTLIYMLIIYFWLQKRNYFPIKERSPYLVLTSVTACSVSCLIIPIAIVIYNFTKAPWINPYTYIKNTKTYRLSLLLRSFEVVLNGFILLPYVIRTLRIYIVFNTKINSRVVRFFFSRESYLIGLVLIACSFFFVFVFFLPECVSTTLFQIQKKLTEECSCFYMQQLFWISFNIIEVTIFLMMAFFTRNIYKEYSLCKEICIMTVINLIYFNIIHILPNFINFNNLCLGALPFLFVFKDLRHIIVAIIVMIYPLSICTRAHIPLVPSLTLDEMNFFLLEEKFFVVFYKFLQNLEEKAKVLPLRFDEFNEKLYGTKYLRFFLDIKIVGENKKAMDNKIKENFFNYLNEEYFKHFTCWSEQIEELRFKNRENTLLFNDFKEIYRLVYSQLNIYFKDYQKTVSYLLLKRSLRENDLVNARLYSYNILTKLE